MTRFTLRNATKLLACAAATAAGALAPAAARPLQQALGVLVKSAELGESLAHDQVPEAARACHSRVSLLQQIAGVSAAAEKDLAHSVTALAAAAGRAAADASAAHNKAEEQQTALRALSAQSKTATPAGEATAEGAAKALHEAAVALISQHSRALRAARLATTKSVLLAAAQEQRGAREVVALRASEAAESLSASCDEGAAPAQQLALSSSSFAAALGSIEARVAGEAAAREDAARTAELARIATGATPASFVQLSATASTASLRALHAAQAHLLHSSAAGRARLCSAMRERLDAELAAAASAGHAARAVSAALSKVRSAAEADSQTLEAELKQVSGAAAAEQTAQRALEASAAKLSQQGLLGTTVEAKLSQILRRKLGAGDAAAELDRDSAAYMIDGAAVVGSVAAKKAAGKAQAVALVAEALHGALLAARDAGEDVEARRQVSAEDAEDAAALEKRIVRETERLRELCSASPITSAPADSAAQFLARNAVGDAAAVVRQAQEQARAQASSNLEAAARALGAV